MRLLKFVLASTAVIGGIACSVVRSDSRPAADDETPAVLPAPESTPARSAAATNTLPATTLNTPEALVREVYRVHGEDFKSNKDRIIGGKSRRYLDKFFNKNLADLIWKDITTHVGEVGVIDFDLFYAAQDAEIRNLRIGKAVIEGKKATVPVSFTNYGTKETLSYMLVKEQDLWKIADIGYRDGDSLLKYFNESS